ncbi:hypothetical protein [Nocardioides jiangsuensis]|uniref:hypothetical protein n=1 Tax=Nocardioides jiangsuensis TaxID=2866161 RepID=UPI001CED2970|nr:hypothetical protein [Nocardioides jiangsuensis]
MSTTPTPPGDETRDHVIARFSGAALRAFERVATAPAWSMSPAEQRTTLLELDRLTSALAELRLRLLAAADKGDVGAASGASSTAGWSPTRHGRFAPRCPPTSGWRRHWTSGSS